MACSQSVTTAPGLPSAAEVQACLKEGDLNATHASRARHRVPLLAGIALLAGAVSSPSGAQSPQPPLIAQACAGCHGQAGAGSGSVPRIAGYNRDLFIAQWAAFRAKQRPATMMDRVATGYSDAEVAVLADYFSKLK
jgi:sulfide dehydrogenase cytochrome subunit